MSDAGGASTRPPSTKWPLTLGVWIALTIALGSVAFDRYVPYTFLGGDSAFYLTMQRALLDGATLEMSAYHPMSWYRGELPHFAHVDEAWSNLSLGADGKSHYPKHPYLLPVLLLPLYAAFGPVGSLWFNVLAMAALLAAGFALARRFVGPWPALLAVLPVALCGMVDENLYTVSNDVFYTALLGIGLVAASGRHWALSAAVLALAALAKPVNGLWLPVPFVAALWMGQQHWRGVASDSDRSVDIGALMRLLKGPALAVVLILGIAAVAHWVMWGSPLRTGYHSIVVVRGGEVELVSAMDLFNQPFWEGLWQQITHLHQGLWPRGAILAVAAVLGIVAIRRVGVVGLVPATVLAVYLFVHARYDHVWARFYLPCLLWAPLGLAAPFAGWVRGLEVSERPWPLRSTRWWFSAGVGLVVAALVIGALGHGANSMGGLGEDLKQVRVWRTHGASKIPCDYLNPNTMHFECSRIEHEYWQGWGPDIRGQCQFDRWRPGDEMTWPVEAVEDLWYLHPQRKPISKTVVWQNLGPLQDLQLLLGYANPSRGFDAEISVQINGVEVSLPELGRQGELARVRLTDHLQVDGPNRLEVSVRATGDHDYRQVCVGALFNR